MRLPDFNQPVRQRVVVGPFERVAFLDEEVVAVFVFFPDQARHHAVGPGGIRAALGGSFLQLFFNGCADFLFGGKIQRFFRVGVRAAQPALSSAQKPGASSRSPNCLRVMAGGRGK